MSLSIKNNPILQCVSLLCWVFLFYIPIFNQLKIANNTNQQVAICTVAGIKLIALGTVATEGHTSTDCPCTGQSIAHHYYVVEQQVFPEKISEKTTYTYYPKNDHFLLQIPRAPPFS
ncbi:MAG: hypothetical protein V7784_15705 [Oceanospirillaceae bacterium]